ncbi:MAG: NAD(+)/NADH kinase [Candidatus Diapherotrites archaeon]
MNKNILGIIGRKENKEAKEEALALIKLAEAKKIKLEVDKNFFSCKYSKELEQFNSDIIFSFGGDGTILYGFQNLKKNIPIIGINHGRKGFLQAYEKNESEKALNDFLLGKIVFEERTRILVRVDDKQVGNALNEALIVPQKPGRLLHYSVLIGKSKLIQSGDGLILSTPTGSTAHALSAGGPIIKGNASVFVIVPINPVDWSVRPLVINDHEKILVSDFGNLKAVLVIDGQKWFNIRERAELEKGNSVKIAVKPNN